MVSATRSKLKSSADRVAVWLFTNERWALLLALLVFGAFIVSGMTTSSIVRTYLSQDSVSTTAVQIGMSQWIRSDEYNVSTPIAMAIMADGAPSLSPLGASAGYSHRFSDGGLFSSIVFFPSSLLTLAAFLPAEMVFSAYWWLPMICLVLGMPGWMARIGGTRRLGWLAALLIAFSPSVAWWSLGPVNAMGYTVLGSLFLLLAFEKYAVGKAVTGTLFAVASGVLLASIPTTYVPWALVLAVPVLLATVVKIVFVESGPLRRRVLPVLVAGFVAGSLAIGTLVENMASLQSMIGTVYPGQRRSGGEAQPFSTLFGAPGFDSLSRVDPIISNASELSTSFTVCFVWAAVILLVHRRFGKVRENLPLIVMAGAACIWLLWATVNTGSIGEVIPILNLVPGYRVGQVVGILGVVVVCLLLARLPKGDTRFVALASAASVGGVTAYAVSLFQTEAAPEMRTWLVFASAGGAAVAVYFVTRFPQRAWPILLAGLLALLPVLRSQPILFGLGDLWNSETAHIMRDYAAKAKAEGTLWAADARGLEPLMLASTVPALSGFQRSGPAVEQWERLDPKHEFEYAWNRGGGYIPFVFTPGEAMNITTNGFDHTWVYIDPCELKERFPELGHIASSKALEGSCLVDEGTIRWADKDVFIYGVKG